MNHLGWNQRLRRNTEIISRNQPYLRVSTLREQKQTKHYISGPKIAAQLGGNLGGRLVQPLLPGGAANTREDYFPSVLPAMF